MKGRLRECLAFWKDIGASKWVLDVLRDGYSLPFMSLPQKAFFNNHSNIAEEQEFVCQEVAKLLASGAVTEVRKEELMVCNPLGVVMNSAHKPQLIVDLHYVNQHLRSLKYKCEDIRTAACLFSKVDWFFKLDYKSGYQHLEILPQHCQFLGFSLFFGGKLRFFQFTVLPFGLSVGPYLFTKIQRALGLSSFIANEEKSQWVPSQLGELLGFALDLQHGLFWVPARRVVALKQLIDTIIDKNFLVSARCLSRLSGSLVSMGLALGPVVRLWTRGIYRDICQAD